MVSTSAWVLVAGFPLWLAEPAQADYTYITNFTKTANDQTNLQASFPAGLFTANNSIATPFDITSDANGKNISEVFGFGSTLVISNVNLTNVSAVYTLMNEYAPVSGALASVEFLGSAGADQTFTLLGGVDIRDFYQGSWQNAINGATSQNAYQINNVIGGAGTGNSSTGDFGTYHLDEQVFILDGAFLGQTLQTIKITNLSRNSTPFLAAVTAQQSPLTTLFSETFTNLTFNPGWRFTSPNPASSNWLDGTALTILASWQNGGSDLYSGTDYAAPRLLQPVAPWLNWFVEAKFDFSPGNNYQGAGILLADTNGAFQADSDLDRIAERAFYPNAGGPVIRAGGMYVGYTNAVSYVRVQKVGTNYTGWYSADGTNWALNGSTVLNNQRSYIGLFSIRYAWDSAQVNSTPAFYYFNVLPPSVSINAVSNNAVALSWPGFWSSPYLLEQSPALVPANWMPSTNPISVLNGSNYITISPATGTMFFRLLSR